MSRATKTGKALFIFFLSYVILKVKMIPTPEPFYSEVLDLIPFWALVTLGSYCLANIGWGIFRLQDRKDAYDELVEEIKEAKSYLSANGVSITPAKK